MTSYLKFNMWFPLVIILLSSFNRCEGSDSSTEDGFGQTDILNITAFANTVNSIPVEENQSNNSTHDVSTPSEVVIVTPPPSNESAAMRKHKALLAFVKAASKYATYQASIAINTYMLPTVVLLGTVGNILSLLVMLQPANRQTPLCTYMTGLAVNDLCMLIGLGFYSWMVHDILPLRRLPNIECQSGVYFYSVFSINGVLIITVMTIERFIAIRRPLLAASVLSVRRALISLACLAIFSFVFCIPQWLYTQTLANNLCQAFAYTDTFSTIYSWLYLTFNSFLPFTVILILNVYIVSTLRQSRKFRTAFANVHSTSQHSVISGVTKQSSITASQVSIEVGTQTNSGDFDSMESVKDMKQEDVSTDVCRVSSATQNKDGSNQKKSLNREEEAIIRERQLTAMLVLVSLALLVFTIPQCVRYVLTNLYSYTATPQVWADFMLLYSATNKVFFINNAINFYLYCLSGSRFRGDLLKFFRCKKN